MMRRLISILGVAVLVLALAPPAAVATSGTMTITEDTTLTEDHEGNVVIDADDVTLDCAGFSVTGNGEGAGILVEAHTGVAVTNCVATGHERGIVLSDASSSTLSGNTATANVCDGVLVWSSDDNTLTGNASSDNGCNGFNLDGGSDGNVLDDNVARRNANWGYQVARSARTELSGNTARASGEAGFGFIRTRGDQVVGNVSLANSECGFWWQRSSHMTLRDNRAEGNAGDGFSLNHSHDILLVANVASGNMDGLILNGSWETVVRNATSLDNDWWGFSVGNGSDANLFVGNEAKGNDIGFIVSDSSDNTLKRNVACRNATLDAYDDGSGSHNHWRANDFCTSDV